MKKSIGIIGQGFVGTAINEGMRHAFIIETYDKYLDDRSTCESVEDIVDKCDIIFVCLPTPMRKDGSCDIRIVEDVIFKIDKMAKSYPKSKKIAVIKSTIPPGTTSVFNLDCESIQVVFSPEFLTEANAVDDFKNQNRIIVGGPRPASTTVKNLFRKAFPKVAIVKTGSRTAEMVKYFINCFLSTKVSFSNEMKQICDEIEVDFDKVVEYSLYDDRLGNSHWSVPGPDGCCGFGGHCFPKDLNALIHSGQNVGVATTVLEAVWEKNLEVRDNKDWEKMVGRAVSKD